MKSNIQKTVKKATAFLKINLQKRVFPLLVAAALLLCCAGPLAVKVEAADVIVDYGDTSGTWYGTPTTYVYYALSCLFNSTFGTKQNFDYSFSILSNLPDGCVFITCYTSARDYYYGVYWDDDGMLRLGQFYPLDVVYLTSLYGVHYMSDYLLIYSEPCVTSTSSTIPIFRTVAHAFAYSTLNSVSSYVLLSSAGSTAYKFNFLTISSDGFYGSSLQAQIYVSSSWTFSTSVSVWVDRNAVCNFSSSYKFIEQPTRTLEAYNYLTGACYPGDSRDYRVRLDGVDLTAEEILEQVTWSVSGNTSSGTSVNEYGVLTIDPNEKASAIAVTATLKSDSTVTSTVAVSITPLPDADDLVILPSKTTYEIGQYYAVDYCLALEDGTSFDCDSIVWDYTSDEDTLYWVGPTGTLVINESAPVASFFIHAYYSWDTENPIKSIYVSLVEPGTSSGDDSGGSSSGSSGSSGGSVDMTETNEKLDDIISGGEAGEELGNASDNVDQKNEALGGTVDDLENAESRLPEMSEDIETELGDYVSSFQDSNITSVMPWNSEEYADFWNVMITPTLGAVSTALLLYFVFGKARAAA